MTDDSDNPFGKPIYVYTRAQAIEDGVLVDVSDTAREAGFMIPVAVTEAVWNAYVVVPEGITGQDEKGRLWDVLFMAAHGARLNKSKEQFLYSLHVRDKHDRLPLVLLKCHIGPGDGGHPVITIMLPNED